MIKYNFQINKERCFAYWIQAMTKWNWYFDEKEFKYYKNIAGNFDYKENELLEKFKKQILKREPDGGYLWLWDRYSGKQIVNSEDQKLWVLLEKQFSKKFNVIWEKESYKLLKWKEMLKDYDFNKRNNFFVKIEKFFGKTLNQTINVELCLEYNKNSPSGHVKKEFDNLILLNISNLKDELIDKIINTLVHETSHLLDYSSGKEELLKKSYLKIINLKGIKQKKPSWKHLITESIITSIAGVDFSDDEENLKKFDYENNKNNYSYQIKSVAYRLRDLIKDYLDNNKEMDQSFADAVVKTWLDFRIKS